MIHVSTTVTENMLRHFHSRSSVHSDEDTHSFFSRIWCCQCVGTKIYTNNDYYRKCLSVHSASNDILLLWQPHFMTCNIKRIECPHFHFKTLLWAREREKERSETTETRVKTFMFFPKKYSLHFKSRVWMCMLYKSQPSLSSSCSFSLRHSHTLLGTVSLIIHTNCCALNAHKNQRTFQPIYRLTNKPSD